MHNVCAQCLCILKTPNFKSFLSLLANFRSLTLKCSSLHQLSPSPSLLNLFTSSAFILWSPCCGHANLGTPSLAASVMESQSVWLMNPPIGGYDNIVACLLITIPLLLVLFRKDSPNSSWSTSFSSSSSKFALTTQWKGEPLLPKRCMICKCFNYLQKFCCALQLFKLSSLSRRYLR